MSTLSESISGVPVDSPDVASAISIYGVPSSTRFNLDNEDLDEQRCLFDVSYSTDNLSTVAMYELDPGTLDDHVHSKVYIDKDSLVSRSPSRNSTTSVVATKDGIEGRHIKKNKKIEKKMSNGNNMMMTPYSLNLLSTFDKKDRLKVTSDTSSVTSSLRNNFIDSGYSPRCHSPLSQVDSTMLYPDSPNYPPLTLKEKMHLLSHDYIASAGQRDRLKVIEKNKNHSTGSFTSDESGLDSNSNIHMDFHSLGPGRKNSVKQEPSLRYNFRDDINSCGSTVDDKSTYDDNFAGLPKAENFD